MTWLELVKKYFPDVSDEEADFILWEKTAFPMGGLKVVEKQLKQLKQLKELNRNAWFYSFTKKGRRDNPCR